MNVADRFFVSFPEGQHEKFSLKQKDCQSSNGEKICHADYPSG